MRNFGTEIVGKFKGNIYLMPDENLGGRRFWFSNKTGEDIIYFGQDAFLKEGLEGVAKLLTEVQGCLNHRKFSKVKA